jgi:hypothetical protein
VNRWDPDGQASKSLADDGGEREIIRREGYDLLDIHHPDGWTERYQIKFFIHQGELEFHQLFVPGRPGEPCYDDPAFCTCSDGPQFCGDPVNSIMAPWEVWQLATGAFGLGRGALALGTRVAGRARGLVQARPGGVGAVDDALGAAARRGPPAVSIPRLTGSDDIKVLLGESMTKVRQVEGFAHRAQMVRGLFTQISERLKGWRFREAPGLDGSRIFYGDVNATIVRPNGQVYRAGVSPSIEKDMASGVYTPPYDRLQLLVP